MNKKSFCLLIALSLIVSNVFASTTTYERTLDNLQISDDIKVTNFNRDIILTTPKVDETEKVYDFANLFSNYEEERLYNEITEFRDNSDLDMAVVTIDENPRNSAEKYADDFYDYNYFGSGSTRDGIIFLIDMDTREMWISTTGTAQIMYDDYRIERILDSTYAQISNKEYYRCAVAFVDRAQYYYNLGIPSSNTNASINKYGDYVYNDKTEYYMYVIIPAFIITLIITLIMKGKHKTIKKATTAFAYMQEKNITYKEDTFINTYTSKVYDPPSSSSGSSRSGGSSTHRSSSGRSHGGGGRRF